MNIQYVSFFLLALLDKSASEVDPPADNSTPRKSFRKSFTNTDSLISKETVKRCAVQFV